MRWITRLRRIAIVLVLSTGIPWAAVYGNDSEPAPGGDFTLESASGPVSLSDYHGKVVLLFFGFTSCVDVCPVTLALVGRAIASLTPDEQNRVMALFISLDPERDTPEMLAKYAGYFHENIVGATGSEPELDALVDRYGVTYERREMQDSALGYTISHTPDVLVVNQEGELLADRIPVSASSADIAEEIKKVLQG